MQYSHHWAWAKGNVERFSFVKEIISLEKKIIYNSTAMQLIQGSIALRNPSSFNKFYSIWDAILLRM
jgi:hypothetical protein